MTRIKNFGVIIMNNNEFKSEIYSLGDHFFEETFNIPIYQRLYVWGSEQVNTLLEDLIYAYLYDIKSETKKIYYLGGIVVVENSSKFDLIDGQQRFTTLKILRDILDDVRLTLEFSIRKDVWREFALESDSTNLDIQRMKDAQKLLNSGLEKNYNGHKINRVDFLRYIREQVNLVVTQVPRTADLNKLFELINGRGEQLQQHEILKAKILKYIVDPSENKKYGKIWDICANMNQHVDINIKKIIMKEDSKSKDIKKLKKISWSDYFNEYNNLDFETLLDKLDFKNDKSTIQSYNSIHNIIKQDNDGESDIDGGDPEDEASTVHLSIISFPLFLLYSLVALKGDDYFKCMQEEKVEFKDKNLIKIFEFALLKELTDDKAKKFIEYLFKFRKSFDKWIIRNQKDIGDKSHDTNHQILYIKKLDNGKNTTREIKKLEDSDNLALLQSMLYHSHTRNTQEWIIPFLSHNIKNNNCVENNLELLKNIDNVLYSQFNTTDTVLERANSFSEDNCVINCTNIINYIKKEKVENYHYFSQYWFYKMDWIIWCFSNKKDSEFRFTARNSIEHISPQTKKEENKVANTVSDKFEHSFGNLTLISIGQNSSFSNKGYLEKMGEFKEKKIQNLKMKLIYENEIWNDEKCKKHLYECLQKIKIYYQVKGVE